MALANGQAEKLALLRFNMDPASILSATVTIAAPGDEPNSDFNPDQAVLRACLVTADWQGGAAQPYDRLPAVDCSHAVPGRLAGSGATRTVSFDIGVLVAQWAAGTPNRGIAIEPDSTQAGGQAPSTWQIGLHGASRNGITVRAEQSGEGGSEEATSSSGASSSSLSSSSSSSSSSSGVGSPASSLAGVTLAYQGTGDLSSPPATPASPPPAVASGGAAPAAQPAGVLAGIPVNRRFEVAVLWALALLAAALGLLSVARASARPHREIRLAASGGLVSVLVLGAAWQGAASQAATWAQVPYLASGALLGIVIALVSATLGLAPVMRVVASRRR